MHIPDGFLDTKTAIVTSVLSATGLGTALHNASRHVESRQVPLMGLTAAFIFVAQMINFPVAGGTSGHLLGATLAAILLGPGAAVIVMSCVLIIQALIFADGGLLALGANALNMALVATISGYGVYRLLHRWLHDQRGQLISASVAAWFSTVLASIFCAGELALSGTVAWNLAFPAMAGIHSLIGIGEAAITMLVLAAIANTRPELLRDRGIRLAPQERKGVFVFSVVIILGLLVLVVPYASSLPDGLNKVAQSLGFEYRANVSHALTTPFAEYSIPGIDSPALASILAGLIGAVVVFGLSVLLARVLVPKQKTSLPPLSD
jgi:cobalt/nickel transport system permease protein